MEIEIAGVFSALEQTLRFYGCLRTDCDQGEAQDIHFAGGGRGEEIGDTETTALFLAREGEAEDLFCLRGGGRIRPPLGRWRLLPSFARLGRTNASVPT